MKQHYKILSDVIDIRQRLLKAIKSYKYPTVRAKEAAAGLKSGDLAGILNGRIKASIERMAGILENLLSDQEQKSNKKSRDRK